MTSAVRWCGRAACCTLLLATVPAWAQSADAKADTGDDANDELSQDDLDIYKKLGREPSGYGRFFATTGFGRGLRFNNPFRLQSQLGDSAESVSATAPYWDTAVALAFGAPNGFQNGAALHFAIAMEGVGQQSLSASYLLLYRADLPLMGYGRIGPVLLTSPDPNVGGELAFGGAYFFTGALGATAEVVGNLFYGAGTYEVAYSVIPTLSFQAGIIADFEVLP